VVSSPRFFVILLSLFTVRSEVLHGASALYDVRAYVFRPKCHLHVPFQDLQLPEAAFSSAISLSREQGRQFRFPSST
jgi:hypothetical protein